MTSAPQPVAPAPLPPNLSIAASPPATATSPLAWGFGVLCAALLGYILGRSAAGWDTAGGWPGLAIGLAFVVVAGGGFALGKGSAR